MLAESPVGPQAYRIGRSLGVQFHPEVTTDIVEEWVSLGGEKLARDGVDADRLLAETRRARDREPGADDGASWTRSSIGWRGSAR